MARQKLHARSPTDVPNEPDVGRRPTITHRTIADRLGISQSTVSLVLNGKAEGRVAPKLRDAVLQTAHALGYQPNVAARTLRLGQSRVIALLVPQVDNPFFPPVYLGAERAARARGYTIVLVNAEEQRETQEHLLATLAAHTVDGFVVWRAPAVDSIADLRQRLVLADDDNPDLLSVQFDIPDGTRQALDHLRALGHTRIAALGADVDHGTFRMRQKALRNLLTANGLALAAAGCAPLDLDAAQAAAAALLRAAPRPTAIICDDDLLAVGVYHAARAAGLAIPDHLSVVSFGGTSLARVLLPTLTTVALPAAGLGAQAVTLLLERLAGNAPAPVILPVQLRIAGSTAAPQP